MLLSSEDEAFFQCEHIKMNESVSKCDFSVIKEITAHLAALRVIVFNAGTGTLIASFITDFYCHGGAWGGMEHWLPLPSSSSAPLRVPYSSEGRPALL